MLFALIIIFFGEADIQDFPVFKLDYLFLIVGFESSLYILDILYQIYLLPICSPSQWFGFLLSLPSFIYDFINYVLLKFLQ